MSARVDDWVAKIRALERLIEDEVDASRQREGDARGYRVEDDDVRFDAESAKRHLAHRKGILEFLGESPLTMLAAAPFIYAMIVPLLVLDASASLYQAACFRLYGIARVARARYVVLDRRRLGYLNAIEKLNCDYCSYANGVIAYAREIASRTEQYFCPIKHARRVLGAHERYREFLEYGDAAAWRRELPVLRQALRDAT
jgi:hypothetical protein